MLANAPLNFFFLFIIIVLIILALAILAGMVIIVRNWIQGKKSRDYTKVKYNLICVLCMVIAAVSWITNFGWVRFFMTLVTIPFIHAIVFFSINFFAVTQIKKSHMLKVLTLLSFVTYLCGYIFLPDGGDVGPMYVFFGLLHNDSMYGLCSAISWTGFAGNVVFMVLQMIEAIKIRRATKTADK